MNPYPHQADLIDRILASWESGNRNVLAVAPTGSGKSLILSHCVKHRLDAGPAAVIAHRKELVSQMAMALAREGIRHAVIGPNSLVKFVIQEQITELGTNFYNPGAQTTVVSVDSLNEKKHAEWGKRIRTWVLDEGHHCVVKRNQRDEVVGNKWGRAITTLFPHALGLGGTATPHRADGLGLGAHADGLFHDMVLGPTPRELIEAGFLSDYDVVCPESDLKMMKEQVGATGDYTAQALKTAAKKSHIVGDVSSAYRKFAPGKQAVVFATDIETAGDIAQQLQRDGVKAEVVSSHTSAEIRASLIRQFRNRSIQVLVNVDLFGEGFDVPGIEVVVMARPTESFGLYAQQCGRALRIFKGKGRALLIDMVGNFRRHGPPDSPKIWTLDRLRGDPRSANPEDTVPQRTCYNCTQPYPRFHPVCPHCGTPYEPAGRGTIEQVDGELALLDPAVLAALRGEVTKALQGPEQAAAAARAARLPDVVVGSIYKSRKQRLEHVAVLQACMAWWAQMQADRGRSEREIERLFYSLFGIDRMSALAMGSAETDELARRVTEAMTYG